MAYKIKSTKHASPPRIVLHGGEKVGKSTFASQAPNALFLPTEEGLKGINTRALVLDDKPRLESYEEFDNALAYCESHLDEFDTLVIDSADWLESLIHKKICQDYNVETIEQALGGFNKGFTKATDLWRGFLNRLDDINHYNKAIIIVCHSKAVLFNDPLGEPYDRWQMKLHTNKGANGSLEVVQEWADITGFAQVEQFTRKTQSDESKHRAVISGKRWLHLQETAGFIAGNRYGLPAKIELSWGAFMDAFSTVNNQPINTTKEAA